MDTSTSLSDDSDVIQYDNKNIKTLNKKPKVKRNKKHQINNSDTTSSSSSLKFKFNGLNTDIIYEDIKSLPINKYINFKCVYLNSGSRVLSNGSVIINSVVTDGTEMIGKYTLIQ